MDRKLRQPLYFLRKGNRIKDVDKVKYINVWGQAIYIMGYIGILYYQIFVSNNMKIKGNAFLSVHCILFNPPELMSCANKITGNGEKKHWIEFFSRQSANEGF